MKVTLKKPHEHAGIPYAPKDVIEVDAATAAWLEQHGVIDKADAEESPRKDKFFNRKEKEQ